MFTKYDQLQNNLKNNATLDVFNNMLNDVYLNDLIEPEYGRHVQMVYNPCYYTQLSDKELFFKH